MQPMKEGGVYTILQQPMLDGATDKIRVIDGPGNHVTKARMRANEILPLSAKASDGPAYAVIVRVEAVLAYVPALVPAAVEQLPTPKPESPEPPKEPEPLPSDELDADQLQLGTAPS